MVEGFVVLLQEGIDINFMILRDVNIMKDKF